MAADRRRGKWARYRSSLPISQAKGSHADSTLESKKLHLMQFFTDGESWRLYGRRSISQVSGQS